MFFDDDDDDAFTLFTFYFTKHNISKLLKYFF